MDQVRRISAEVEPDYTFLVIDAMTGQDAVTVAESFHNTLELDGVILTKLDGTAKGGIVFAVQRQLGVPVKFVGLGEVVDDLAPFDPEVFVESLLG